MIDNAFKYETEIRELMIETMYDERYKYYHSSIFTYIYKQPEDISRTRQFVSKKGDKIIGLIGYQIIPETSIVCNFGAINFTDELENKIIFGMDLKQVIDDIFCKFNMNKLEFNVVCGNPIEKKYDKIIEKIGGRIIGYRKDSVKLIDNNIYDDKLYEIMRKDYLNFKKSKNCNK